MTTQQGSELFSAIVAAPFGAIGIRPEDARVREMVYLQPRFHEKAGLQRHKHIQIERSSCLDVCANRGSDTNVLTEPFPKTGPRPAATMRSPCSAR